MGSKMAAARSLDIENQQRRAKQERGLASAAMGAEGLEMADKLVIHDGGESALH